MEQYFGINTNLNSVNSPYQVGNSNVNNLGYYYTPTSPANGLYSSSNQAYPINYLNYNSYLSTPSSDNKSFSSGYASENSTFNSPVVAKSLYGYYNNNLIHNQVLNQNQNLPKQSKPAKRTREENSLVNNHEVLIKQIFDSDEPTSKKPKRSYNKKKELNEPLIENQNIIKNQQLDPLNSLENEPDFFDENDFDNFNFIDDSQNEKYNGEKKKRVLTKNQRIAANLRERKRMNIMNEAFVNLREALPITTGRKRRKMSRLDIVVGAMEYIAYLDSLLEKEVPGEIDFDAYQNTLYLS